MDIRIQKETTVSLHSQLVTQISMQIASGLLKPGAKLPSIRSLSKKLDIHHNTCLSAYRELADVGLIELKHGSGARVKVLAVDQSVVLPESSDLAVLAEFFIEQIRHRRYSWEEAKTALDLAREKMTETSAQWVFVDLHADILPVFKAELEQALKISIRTVTLDELDPQAERQSYFLVSRYHFQALQDRLKKVIKDPKQIQKRITVIEVGSGQQELSQIRKVPDGTLIVLVSASTIILRQAEAVIQALRGEDILIRTLLFGQEPASEVKQLCKRAKVIFADWLCLPKLQAFSSVKIQPIRTIPAHEIEKMKGLIQTDR
jgi:GntR family transcriptional regulator